MRPPRIQTAFTLAGAMIASVLLACLTPTILADEIEISRTDEWQGNRRVHFRVASRNAYVVLPKKAMPGKPWIWRARFPGYHAEMDIELVRLGFHLGYVDVAGMFGGPQAMQVGDAFFETVTRHFQLSPKPVLEGVSRGGLFVYNWLARNPDKASCVYCDTPVCDFKSWPAGLGNGIGSTAAWRQCLNAYQLTEEQAKSYASNPVDSAEAIAKANIPLLHIVSENDQVVPPKENTYLLKSRLADIGRELEVISVPEGTAKSNGHHFTHPEQDRVVKFILRHGTGTSAPNKDAIQLLSEAKRVLFLGDSITYAGHYVAFFDAWLTANRRSPPAIINAGLPSETVSGLSENGHAGGRFPRPDLHERLERVLATVKPDLVIACYGINCGIYQPLNDERLRSYQDGVRRLRSEVESVGAALILVTPPTYDDQRRSKGNFQYNMVMAAYSSWLTDQAKDKGWPVIDLHGPMTAELNRRRMTDKAFTFQPDAVHPNEAGHWFMAQQLIRAFGGDASRDASPTAMLKRLNVEPQILGDVRRRINIRRDAYLAAAKHLRPGIRSGLPVSEAEAEASKLSDKLQDALPERE